MHGLIVDNFAGGGGASTGIAQGLGRPVDIAINHDPVAVAMHKANHPTTRHHCQSVFRADPLDVTGGRPVDLAWFSPDCKHHSKAKGGKPRESGVRDLAWVVVLWAERVKPRVIILENVEEFRQWGPLRADGRPCKDRAGDTFNFWVRQIRRAGYKVEWRELRACDYGAPTIRKRLFVIARCDGLPIVWPDPTHAPAHRVADLGLKPYRTAAECIDWSLPCPSIFMTADEASDYYRATGIRVRRPLADATMARIAKGVQRYVIDHADPFVVGVGGRMGQSPPRSVSQPFQTMTTKADGALVAPYLVPRYGERDGQEPRCRDVNEPSPTVVPTANHASLVAAFLAQHNTGVTGRAADAPMSTVMRAGCQQALVASHIINLKGSDRRMSGADEPAPTITAGGWHVGEVRAFLAKYYGSGGQVADCRDPAPTATVKARLGIVMVHGQQWQIVDIGMRMFTPRELFRANGYPEDYQIDVEVDGRPLTKTEKIAACGNGVPPVWARAISRANLIGDVPVAHEAAQ